MLILSLQEQEDAAARTRRCESKMLMLREQEQVVAKTRTVCRLNYDLFD
jgi:hypothetical protein